ncbi:MAG: HAMP domain-containing protein [Planctomycetota bacterium]|nr:HAMP domain-containing protein [Planctomycetota bacterium]
MLRRKLIIALGALVALLLVAAIVAMLLLQNVLEDLDHVSNTAMVGTTRTGDLGLTITRIEAELNEIRLRKKTHLDDLINAVERLMRQVEELGDFYVVKTEATEHHERLLTLVPAFVEHVGSLATTRDPELSAIHADQAMAASTAMRREVAAIHQMAQEHVGREQLAATTKFRWVVIGVAIVFLAVINLSILALLRASTIILRPVDRLVEASRRLAREEFDHRVEVAQHDEFDELALAFNHLAEQLQLNEQRKIETLQHVARTLNHELNNAVAIIELQLSRLARSSDANQSMAEPLEEIHRTLERMSRTVDALKRIRRIVLTDYLEGVKMLDLERSVEGAAGHAESASDPGRGG